MRKRTLNPHVLRMLVATATALLLLSPELSGDVSSRAEAAGWNALQSLGPSSQGQLATPTAAATGTLVETATATPTSGLGQSPTPSATPTTPAADTATPTATPVTTATATSATALTATATTAATATATAVLSPTATVTPTVTPTVTATSTTSPTATPTVATATSSNDEIDAATPIDALPFGASQDTTKATVAYDDPYMGAGSGINSNTVWYRFVASDSGGVRANTFGSSYDTVLAAFTGSRGNLALVVSNDDSSGGAQSQIGFSVQAGTTYYLEVAQYGAPRGGQLRLTVEFGDVSLLATPSATPTATVWPYWIATPTPTVASAAPANDDIGSATLVGGLPFADSFDTSGATLASDDPNMGTGSGVNSNTVWYRLMPAAAGVVRANTFGSGYDTVLAVYTGSRGSLALAVSNDDASSGTQSEVVFNARAGTTYYLEVAQYGASRGGQLRLTVEGGVGVLAGTPTPTVNGTPAPSVTPGVLGAAPPAAPPQGRAARSTRADARYFQETGYGVNVDAFWDYFQKRGGVRNLGYPVSSEFTLMGFEVQMFQRAILQLMPEGSVATMNLLDDGLMPYDQINFSTFPASSQELIDAAPSPSDPNYGDSVTAFLLDYVPDQWEGLPVNFLQTFNSTVRLQDAFPEGGGEGTSVTLLNLEMWGLPTSRPAYDPNNHGFVYQRFQRGILHFDVSTGATQGLLLADYLKSLMTGEGLPPDLDLQARDSAFYRQYNRGSPGYLARPQQLPGSNLQGAFERTGP